MLHIDFDQLLQRLSGRHLCLCGVRCNVGRDDICFPTVVSLALKATWFFASLGAVIYLFLHPGCPDLALPPLLSVSLIGFLVIQLAGAVNHVIIIITSSLGSLSDFVPRKKVDIFIYIGCVIYFVQIGWGVCSTYAIFSPQVVDDQLTNCTSYATSLTVNRAVILSHWAVVLLMFAGFACFLDPCGVCLVATKIKDIEDDLKAVEEKRKKAESRIQSDGEDSTDFETSASGLHSINCAVCVYTCRQNYCNSQSCSRQGERISVSKENALRDFTNVFQVLFEGMDYTFLDLWSGFNLAMTYHEKLRENGRDPADVMRKKTLDQLKSVEGYEPSAENEPPSLSSEQIRQEYGEDIQYYMNYAMAAYGCLIHIYLSPCRGLATLCCRSCRCVSAGSASDDECSPNKAAIEAMTGLDGSDIIDYSGTNGIHIVPFYVAKVNKEGRRKEIIIAVRGTLSMKDVLTDFSVCMKRIKGGLMNAKPDCYVHRGFWEAAKGVYNHIMKREGEIKKLVLKENYRIVLTGHSLGAGVASVLAVLFKDKHPDVSKDLIAYTFSTPGAVFSYNLAKESESFILTVISGHDVVPRMTVRGLGHFVHSVEDLVKNSKTSKVNVLCCNRCCGWEPEHDEVSEVEQRQADSLQDLKVPRIEDDSGGKGKGKRKTRFGVKLKERMAELINRKKGSRIESDGSDADPMMFIPGRVIHLESESDDENRAVRCCSFGQSELITATLRRREELSTISVHPSMLLDHEPRSVVHFVHTFCNQNSTKHHIGTELAIASSPEEGEGTGNKTGNKQTDETSFLH